MSVERIENDDDQRESQDSKRNKGRREFLQTLVGAGAYAVAASVLGEDQKTYKSADEIMKDLELTDEERLKQLEKYWMEQAEKESAFTIHHFIDYKEYKFADAILNSAIEHDERLEEYRKIINDQALSDAERETKLQEFWKAVWPSICIQHFAVFRSSPNAREIMMDAVARDREGEAVDTYTSRTYEDEFYAKDIPAEVIRSNPDAVITRFEEDHLMKSLRNEVSLEKAYVSLADRFPYLLFLFQKLLKNKPYEKFVIQKAFEKSPRVFVGAMDDYLEKPFAFALAEKAAHQYPAEFYCKIESMSQTSRTLLKKSSDPVVRALVDVYEYKFNSDEKETIARQTWSSYGFVRKIIDIETHETGSVKYIDHDGLERTQPTDVSKALYDAKVRIALLVEYIVKQSRSIASMTTVVSNKKMFAESLHDLQKYKDFLGSGSLDFIFREIIKLNEFREFRKREVEFITHLPEEFEERKPLMESYEKSRSKGEPVLGVIAAPSLHQLEEAVYSMNSSFSAFPKDRHIGFDELHRDLGHMR